MLFNILLYNLQVEFAACKSVHVWSGWSRTRSSLTVQKSESVFIHISVVAALAIDIFCAFLPIVSASRINPNSSTVCNLIKILVNIIYQTWLIHYVTYKYILRIYKLKKSMKILIKPKKLIPTVEFALRILWWKQCHSPLLFYSFLMYY